MEKIPKRLIAIPFLLSIFTLPVLLTIIQLEYAKMRKREGWKSRESEFPPTGEEEKDYGAESGDCLNHGLHRVSQITRIRVFGEGKE